MWWSLRFTILLLLRCHGLALRASRRASRIARASLAHGSRIYVTTEEAVDPLGGLYARGRKARWTKLKA